jgi:hypothetical protein
MLYYARVHCCPRGMSVDSTVRVLRHASEKGPGRLAERAYARIFAATLLCALLVLFTGSDVMAQEQYVVVNSAPGEEHELVFKQIQRIAKRKATDRIGLGIGAIFSYLNQPRDQCRDELNRFLSWAERYDIPIVVQLDGEQWWDARPDLWNWWDPERPGYDPENAQNVEWSGWGPEYAMKIAWRNWGTQMRVLPPPNLVSPRYRKACHDEMRVLIPLILQWWKRLPDDKRHLLIGIKLGWESSIGVNAFYYPNGNELLNLPVDKDPHIELKGELVPDRGVRAIGYAAVTTAHLADKGELQENHLAEIVRRHLNGLCALAAGLGVPREKLFTHVGGWKDEELLYDTALNEYSCPGWSFYRYASDPAKDRGVQRALRKSGAPWWAAVEWLLMGKHSEGAWQDAITRTLAIPKCRYMCIYNWSGIKDDPAATEAIEHILDDRKE